MPISDKHKIIFIHIPKNAGTAITNALGMQDVGHHFWDYYKKKYPKQWSEYRKIAVIRNPWDRVVSNYEYARMPESYWHSVSGKSRYPKHLDYDKLKDLPFADCINMLYVDRNFLKHQGWKSQYPYIYDGDKCIADVLINQNDVNGAIFDLTGIKVDKVNQSKRDDYKKYYNANTIELVSKIYEKDIKLFNFNYE